MYRFRIIQAENCVESVNEGAGERERGALLTVWRSHMRVRDTEERFI